MVTVVALMTILVGFLSGLTGGLANANVSALTSLDPDHWVFSVPQGEEASYDRSSISSEQLDAYERAGDVRALGVATAGIERGERTTPIALFGIDERGAGPDSIVVPRSVADDLGVTEGDTVRLAGTELTIGGIEPDLEYSHMAVAWVDLSVWQDYERATGQPESAASVLLISGEDPGLDGSEGTVTKSGVSALMAVDSLRAEVSSLAAIIVMLVVVSALVTGVFFLVWTMQRKKDFAVLKALGAPTGYLVRDTLSQALIVLALGAAIGLGVTYGAGAALSGVMPFLLHPLLLLAPPVFMVVTGLLGSLLSIRQVTSADPLEALSAAAN